MTIYNERQETMFNTDLTTAVDEMRDLVKQKRRVVEKIEKQEKELIELMKQHKVTELNSEDFKINLVYVEAKEKIKATELDPVEK